MLGQATWIQLNFNSYLCEKVVINYQKVEIESSILFWWNDETLSANLVYQSDYEIGGTFQVVEQMKIMTWWSSAWTCKEEREKQKAQGKGINGRSYFVLVIKAKV